MFDALVQFANGVLPTLTAERKEEIRAESHRGIEQICLH